MVEWRESMDVFKNKLPSGRVKTFCFIAFQNTFSFDVKIVWFLLMRLTRLFRFKW